MANRVKKLEIDNKKAEDKLLRTLDFQDRADETRKRRMEDQAFKTAWLKEQNEGLLRLRENNL